MNAVNLSPEFNEQFVMLQKKADNGNGEAKYLLKLIGKGISKLAERVDAGKKIPKKLWPAEYVRKYGINNLWKLNLDSYWRMVYTIVGTRIELVTVILDVMDHSEYDRKFGYDTS